tara:strand:- start:159 stop:380 length:222 start_codon:yes stop_codon:yes gene_type:complete
MIKVGDLVQTTVKGGSTKGLVTELYEKKHWDTSKLGTSVDWSLAPMRDFAKVLAYDGREHRFLIDDLVLLEKK